MQRYLSVDILRGIAILLMIQVHFVDNLSSSEESSAWLYNVSGWLGMLPAPLFTLLSGLSFSLWTRKQQAREEGDDTITKIAVRRGLFLFGAGIVFNFFVWLPEETFNWDILTLIGSALVILAYARKLPSEVLTLLCLLVLLLSPPLRVMSEYASYWETGAFEYDYTFRDVLLGFVLNGYFPLFPWLVFPFTGFLIGEVGFRHSGRSNAWLLRLAGTGIGLLSLAAFGLFFSAEIPSLIAKYYTEGFNMYPPSTEYVLGMLGFSMVCLAGLHRWIDLKDRNKSPGQVVKFLQRWSFFSLTVYILHHLVHIWPLWIYGACLDQENPTFFWRQAMGTSAAFGLALAFIVLCTFALIFLERCKRYSFESLMRWLCE